MAELWRIFHWSSLAMPLAVMLPNLLFFATKPMNVPEKAAGQALRNGQILEIFERIGQIGITVAPLFFRIDLTTMANMAALLLMLLSLLIYYGCWARYFIQGRAYSLLFSPLGILPIPMAVSPILAMLFAAKLLNSYVLLAFVILLAIGHIPISYHEHRICEKAKP